jgi:hypothetical protein
VKKTILIFGNGYVSGFLAKNLKAFGWTIYCTSRKIQLGNPIVQENITLINFLEKTLPSIIKSSDVILSSVPPQEEIADPVLQTYGHLISKNNFKWIGYLSSTSVYGDHGGDWVYESTPCKPRNEKSVKRLFAEEQWLDLYSKHNLPVHILRLSGIYGPNRNCLEDIINGKDFTIIKENQYFSRIHIDDICTSILSSIEQPTPGEIYNISDDEPCQINKVHQYGAQILNREKLKEIHIHDAVLSEGTKCFFQDNKKVSNKKLIQQFNMSLKYPTYHSGLLGIKEEMT